MLVYRLEDDNGNGPFWTGNGQAACDLLISHLDPEKPEMLASAGLRCKEDLMKHDYMLFAWRTKKLAKRFVKDHNKLKDIGYAFSVYYVDKWSVLRFLDGQVMFNPASATLVNRFNFTKCLHPQKAVATIGTRGKQRVC